MNNFSLLISHVSFSFITYVGNGDIILVLLFFVTTAIGVVTGAIL